MAVGLGSLAIGVGMAGLVPGGAVIVGIGLLAGALVGLAAVNWERIDSWAKSQLSPERTKATNDKMSKWMQSLTGDGSAASVLAKLKATFKDLTDGSAWLTPAGRDLPRKIMAFFGETAQTITKGVSDIAQKLRDGVLGLPNLVSDAIARAFAAIGKMISSAIDGLGNLLPGGKQLPRPGGHPGEAPGDNVQHTQLMPPQKDPTVVVNNAINLDGRKLASIVSTQLVNAATYPTSAFGQDTWGSWAGPSAYPSSQ